MGSTSSSDIKHSGVRSQTQITQIGTEPRETAQDVNTLQFTETGEQYLSTEVSSEYLSAERHLKKGELEIAKARLLRAIEIEPDHFLYRYTLGKIYLEEENFNGADEHLKKSIALCPEDKFTLNCLIKLKIKTNDCEEAEVWMDKALKIAPNDIRTLLIAGQLQELVEDFNTANTYYTKIIQLHTNIDIVYLYAKIALNYVKLRQKDRAYTYYKLAKVNGPNHPMLCCYNIYYFFLVADYATAMQNCKTFNTKHFKIADTNRSELWFIWALSYKYRTQKKRVKDALDFLSEATDGYYKDQEEVDQDRQTKMLRNRLKSQPNTLKKTKTFNLPSPDIKRTKSRSKTEVK